jgi:hypothetical protein
MKLEKVIVFYKKNLDTFYSTEIFDLSFGQSQGYSYSFKIQPVPPPSQVFEVAMSVLKVAFEL